MRWHRLGRARVDSALEAAAARRVHEETAGSTLSGRPLVLDARPFGLDTAAYLRAAAGPPAWSRRLSLIQRALEQIEESIAAAEQERVTAAGASRAGTAPTWRLLLESLDLTPLNELIDKHNAYYPVEAGLRMEWPSGRYVIPRGILYPMPRVTVEALIERFEPETSRAQPVPPRENSRSEDAG